MVGQRRLSDSQCLRTLLLFALLCASPFCVTAHWAKGAVYKRVSVLMAQWLMDPLSGRSVEVIV